RAARAELRRLPARLLRLHRHRRVPSRRRERRRQLARHPELLRAGRAARADGDAKRQANADTYAYFGEPVYIYSLKDGINDGFLTPFKVKQIATTLDAHPTRPVGTAAKFFQHRGSAENTVITEQKRSASTEATR